MNSKEIEAWGQIINQLVGQVFGPNEGDIHLQDLIAQAKRDTANRKHKETMLDKRNQNAINLLLKEQAHDVELAEAKAFRRAQSQEFQHALANRSGEIVNPETGNTIIAGVKISGKMYDDAIDLGVDISEVEDSKGDTDYYISQSEYAVITSTLDRRLKRQQINAIHARNATAANAHQLNVDKWEQIQKSSDLAGFAQEYVSTQIPEFEGEFWTDDGISDKFVEFSKSKFRDSDLIDFVMKRAEESDASYLDDVSKADAWTVYDEGQDDYMEDYGQNLMASVNVPNDFRKSVLGRQKNEYYDQNVEGMGKGEFFKNYLFSEGVSPNFIEFLTNEGMKAGPDITRLTSDNPGDPEDEVPLVSPGKFGELIYDVFETVPGLDPKGGQK